MKARKYYGREIRQYDVVVIPFGDIRFGERVIATCASRALAAGVVARNNHGLHVIKIVERERRVAVV